MALTFNPFNEPDRLVSARGDNLKEYFSDLAQAVYGYMPPGWMKLMGYQGSKFPGTAKQIENEAQGSLAFTLALDLGGSGGMGFPDSDNSISHLGGRLRKTPNYSVRPTFYVGRVTDLLTTLLKSQKAGPSGSRAHFTQQDSLRFSETFENILKAQDVLQMNGKQGRAFFQVALSGAAISVGASGDVVVDRTQDALFGTPYQVLRDNAIVTNVLLELGEDGQPTTIDQGTIPLLNTGSATYTPAEGDLMVPAYSLNANGTRRLNFLMSINEHIGADSYPVAGVGIHDPLDIARFKSTVKDAGGNNITFEMLRTFATSVKRAYPKMLSDQPQIEDNSGQPSYGFAWAGRHELANQLLKNEDAFKRRVAEQRIVDPTWGSVLTVDGIPFWEHDSLPKDTCYFVVPSGFYYTMDEPSVVSNQQASMFAPFSHIPETNKAEAVMIGACMCVAAHRLGMGRINNVTGFGEADAFPG